jgi:hypothetical protein
MRIVADTVSACAATALVFRQTAFYLIAIHFFALYFLFFVVPQAFFYLIAKMQTALSILATHGASQASGAGKVAHHNASAR